MKRNLLLSVMLNVALIPSLLAENAIWNDNKLTPEQPFPAAVKAVASNWVGYHLLLEELGEKKRLCEARVHAMGHVSYSVFGENQEELALHAEQKKKGWIYLTPAVEVEGFSWSMGLCKLGRVFGKEDVLQKKLERDAQSLK